MRDFSIKINENVVRLFKMCWKKKNKCPHHHFDGIDKEFFQKINKHRNKTVKKLSKSHVRIENKNKRRSSVFCGFYPSTKKNGWKFNK
jgi:hypothetical protein